MIAGKDSKKSIWQLSSCPGNVSDQVWAKFNSFCSRGYQIKKLSFSLGWFSLITFLYGRYENKNDNMVFTSSSQFEICSYSFTLRGQFEIWPPVMSGQVKVMSRSDHDPSRLTFTSSEASRRAKSFGTICASLSPFCRDLLAKNGLWRHLASQVTYPWARIVSCTQICTDGMNDHDPERTGWFWLINAKREAFSYFSIGL